MKPTWCTFRSILLSETAIVAQPTDIIRTQYTKWRLFSASWGWVSNARNMQRPLILNKIEWKVHHVGFIVLIHYRSHKCPSISENGGHKSKMIEWKFTTTKSTGSPAHQWGVWKHSEWTDWFRKCGVTIRNLATALKLSIEMFFGFYSDTTFNVGRRWGKCNQIMEIMFRKTGNVRMT
jgi:hypothetical protein